MVISQFLQDRAARVTITVTREAQTTITQGFTEQGTQTSTYVFQENRMTIQVREGGNKLGQAQVRIEGVNLANMNNISRLWLTPLQIQAQDTIAIDVWNGSQFVPFFSGTIVWAATDGSGIPTVTLNIEAASMGGLAATAPSPYSVQGAVTLRNVITGILKSTGFTAVFSNATDFDQTITNPRFSGSAVDQIDQCLRAFPKLYWCCYLKQVYFYRSDAGFGDSPITISPQTGMQRAPSYSTSGVTVDKLFDPNIHPGRALTIQSAFTLSGGATWLTGVVSHVLEPNKPGGRWTSSVAAAGLPNPQGTGTSTASTS